MSEDSGGKPWVGHSVTIKEPDKFVIYVEKDLGPPSYAHELKWSIGFYACMNHNVVATNWPQEVRPSPVEGAYTFEMPYKEMRDV